MCRLQTLAGVPKEMHEVAFTSIPPQAQRAAWWHSTVVLRILSEMTTDHEPVAVKWSRLPLSSNPRNDSAR
jgi:hypothetical protein